MLRETHFFIHKAKEYAEAIDSLLPNISSPYAGSFASNKEAKVTRKEMSDLKLRIKLLFREFDKGELFFEKCIWIDENDLFILDDIEKLRHYRHVLTLFIEHLETYRTCESTVSFG